MSLIKCPKCGEMFSDSYKTCPFCEEDEAYTAVSCGRAVAAAPPRAAAAKRPAYWGRWPSSF